MAGEQNQLDMLLRITGADQVAADIKSIGTAADATFQDIKTGADAASNAMSGINASALQEAFQSASAAAQLLAQAATQLSQAITQINFQQISMSVTAFAEGMDKLTAATERSSETAQQGAERYDALAQELDKTRESVGQLGEKIQESGEQFGKSQEKSKGFLETVATVSNAINSVFKAVEAAKNVSTLFGDLGGAAKSMGEGVKAAGEAAKTFTSGIAGLGGAIQGAITILGELITAARALAASALPALAAGIELVGVAFRALLAALGPFGIALVALGVVLTFLISKFSDTKDSLEDTKQAFGGAADSMQKTKAQAQSTVDTWVQLTQSFRQLAAATGQTFQQVQAGQDMFEQMGLSGKKFSETMKAIGKEIKDLDIADEFKQAAEEYEKAQQKIARAQSSLLQNEKSLLESVRARGSASSDSGPGPAQQLLQQRIAQIEALEFANKLRESAKALAEGEKEAADQAKNMGPALRETVDNIEKIIQGEKDISIAGEDADKVMRAFKIAMKEAADGGSNLTAVLLKAVASLDRANAVKIGEAFKISEEDVDRIRRANGELNSADAVVKRLSQSFGAIKGRGQVFEDLQRATEGTTSAWARLNQALQTVGTSETEAKIQAFWEKIKQFFINGAAFIVEKWNLFWQQLPLLAEREMVLFRMDWAEFWGDLVSKAATAIDAIASFAPRLAKTIGATKENADKLKEVARGFNKDAEDAAIELQRIQDQLDKGAGAGTIDFKKTDDSTKKLDEQKKAAELSAKAISTINFALAALNEKTIDKLTDSAKKLADQRNRQAAQGRPAQLNRRRTAKRNYRPDDRRTYGRARGSI
jgi:methyl-accepting chemotaxis protein